MAWSYRSKRTYSRSARRSFRRRRLARPRHRRVYRRRYSSRKSTRSGVIKLTTNHVHTFVTGGGDVNPVVFSPLTLSGFGDYAAAYTHFRLLKAVYTLPRDMAVVDGSAVAPDYAVRYLIAGSRPFASNNPPIDKDAFSPYNYVPAVEPVALRQCRWQKTFFPNATRPSVTAAFCPYTMIGTFGPANATGQQYQRIWEGRRWMPFTWARSSPSYLAFFGPYIYPHDSGDSTTGVTTQVTGTLTVWLQFRGQI